MAITLTAPGPLVETLPANCRFDDEWGWTPWYIGLARRLGGGLIRERQPKLAGRPITLVMDPDASGPFIRSQLLTLAAWRDADYEMVLQLHDAQAFDVVWDHERGAIEARLLQRINNPVAATRYVVTLRFLTV